MNYPHDGRADSKRFCFGHSNLKVGELGSVTAHCHECMKPATITLRIEECELSQHAKWENHFAATIVYYNNVPTGDDAKCECGSSWFDWNTDDVIKILVQ